jgi:hypothetical protein
MDANTGMLVERLAPKARQVPRDGKWLARNLTLG